MAEVIETTPAPTANPAGLSEEVSHSLSAFQQFLAPSRQKEISSEIESVTKAAEVTQTPTEKTEPVTPAEPANGQAKENNKEETPSPSTPEVKPTEKDGQTKKNLFGIGKKQAAAPVVKIENPDQLLEAIKKDFGQEYKSISDLPKFLEVSQEWRKESQRLKAIEEEHNKLKNEITNLPEEFFTAFNDLAAGKDYTEAFKKEKINFSLPVEKQDIKKLVNHYMPGKFTDADFNEEGQEKSQVLEIAEQAARERYVLEKGVHDGNSARIANEAKLKLEAQKAAVASSLNTLKQRFPEMDNDVVKEASSIMEGGAQKILSLFLDKNGSVTADAAVRIVMALHGETELLPRAMEIAANQAETRTMEDILTRGADTPKPTQTGGNIQELTKEEKEQIEKWKNIGDSTKTNTY